MLGVFENAKHRSARRIAFTVAGVFALAGATWVLVTDHLLYQATRDLAFVARIETAKGWIFILMATMLIYFVTQRSVLSLTRAQAVLAAIIDSIADGVLLLGKDRSVQRANEAAMRMLNTRDLVGMDADEFTGRFRVSRLDGSLLPPDQLISQRVFVEGGPLNDKAVLHPPGSAELIISVTAAAVRVRADESPEIVVSVMHDVSEAERMSRMRDQCFAVAAHNLKTPIAIMKANAQALMAAEPTAQIEPAVRSISRQCDRVDLLVQNLFVLARIRTASFQLYKHEVELPLLVEQVSSSMAATLDHEIACELDGDPRVLADQERMALVFRNLLDDAVRTSDPGRPVHVSVSRQHANARILIRQTRGNRAWPCAGELDELGINRLVTGEIVKAHAGELDYDVQGLEATVLLSLPTIEQP